ncbi:MAG: hypothetical protein ACW987_15315 [Candidatus Thorarchaeota archaeon]|jgi:hypothetical protein
MAQFEAIGETTSGATNGTTVVSGNNTKGSWTQLIASTSFTARGMYLGVGFGGGPHELLVDVGIGASSFEVVKIPNLLFSTGLQWLMGFVIPIDIPSASRISVRTESDSAVTTGIAGVICDTHIPELSSYTFASHGDNAGGSKGTDVDPGGTANTKGSYAELAASLASDVEEIRILIGDNSNSARTSAVWAVDIAKGAASSEVVVIPDLLIAARTTGDAMPLVDLRFPGEDFQSQRLSIRAQCDITDATDRLFNVVGITAAGTVA